ncbi:hypothetical protein RIF29_36276 [Crotalaria pallida]|uniref:Type 2 DNA topoisomerase 6 subunit B-like n=1 Tax=Crotalaria pallida TaxID=3830 RepID=A0AAN9EHC0_CROPI
MDFSSVQNLSLHLISSAYQRCRLSDQICRISIALARSSPSLLLSISDTGIGSCLEEYQYLKFSSADVADNWGICTCDRYELSFHQPYGIGSEVCLSSSVSLDLLLAEVHSFLQKMLILGIPDVAIRLVAEDGDVPGSRFEKVFLANECTPLPISASNLELLKSGLIGYVLKHGNNLSNKCNDCFPSWEELKVGSGVACCTENRLHTELVMEAVIVMSNISRENTTCIREYGDKTECQVLYFKDFSPHAISRSCMKALKSTDWKKYGLNLGGIVQQEGCALLEWENLPSNTHIDIVLHSYYKQYPTLNTPRKTSQVDRNLVKKAVKLSLDDLKEKNPGLFLSSRALQIRSYAPDLAKTIAGLILSSDDSDFQGECFSLLGLQSQEVGTENVENCIKEKIVSVIEMNDKEPHKTKEVAPFLFVDDRVQDMEFQENNYEEDE